jgi:hypothetical protein
MIFCKKKIFGFSYFMYFMKDNKSKKASDFSEAFLVARSGIEPLLHG